MKNKKISWLVTFLIIVLIWIAGCFGFQSYQSGSQSTSSPPSEVDLKESWRTYKNSTYNFSVKYPKEYTPSKYDAQSGEYQIIEGINNIVGFYTDEDNPFNNFFEIQIINLEEFNDKDFINIYEDNYKENISHFQTTEYSELRPIAVADTLGKEYEITSLALKTLMWSGVVEKDAYKVKFIQDKNIVYAFYYSDNPLFDQIFSTFQLIK